MNFTLLGTETIYQGKVFAVERVFTRLPDGTERSYDRVRHSGAITVVPVDRQGGIHFVRQYRIGAGESLLELPAGMLEPGEDPLAGALRETREETGMAAGDIQLLGEFYLAPGYSSEYMHAYLATGLRADPLERDDDEFLQNEVIPYKVAYAMAGRGEIQDGKSLAALLLAKAKIEALFG
jgi:ADP-ribose pyrophosphatase